MIQAALGSPWYGHIANTASAQVFFSSPFMSILTLTLSVNYDDICKWSFNFCSEFAVVHLIRILTILSALVSYGACCFLLQVWFEM